MSNATPFVSVRQFPFCVSDISSGHSSDSYVDNLTLSQVMDFAWNVESVTFTMTGSATKGSLSVDTGGTISTNPPGATNYDRGSGGGMWIPSASSNTAWASWGSAKEPRERVCESVDGRVLGFSGNNSANPTTSFFGIDFYVGTDPVNSGKFRVYYYFAIVLSDVDPPDSLQVSYNHPASGGLAEAWNSGTITIGGIGFDWESSYDTGATTSGSGTLSVSSSNYTY